ncbi:MAG: hypothetical protein L0191_00895, partial [Acidobacteria bacterium]|nr:hypothetical protein [Acidobacteriota bacterium]
MSHVPQLPGRQWLHPAATEPLTVWLPTPLKAYVFVLAQQQHVSPSTLVEGLLVAEQRTRGAEMPAEGAPETPSEASPRPDLCPAALARHPETVPRSLQALLRAEFDAVTAVLAAAVTEQVAATLTGQLPALIHAEVARALQAVAPAAETRTGATASSVEGNTALCSSGTGPVVAAATPPQGVSSPGSGVLRLTPSALRQHIVAVLQNRLEGLTPPQVQALIGTDIDLRALMRRMFREGLIARPAKGVYAVKTPGAPHSSLGPAGETGETTEEEGHFQEVTPTADLPLQCCFRDS